MLVSHHRLPVLVEDLEDGRGKANLAGRVGLRGSFELAPYRPADVEASLLPIDILPTKPVKLPPRAAPAIPPEPINVKSRFAWRVVNVAADRDQTWLGIRMAKMPTQR